MTTNDHKQMAQALVKAWELLAEHHREMLSHENATKCPVCHGFGVNRTFELCDLLEAAWKAKDFLKEHEVPAQSGWQPMETAPKDGSWVLLRGLSGYFATPWAITEGHYAGNGWRRCDKQLLADRGLTPTHWMPIPS